MTKAKTRAKAPRKQLLQQLQQDDAVASQKPSVAAGPGGGDQPEATASVADADGAAAAEPSTASASASAAVPPAAVTQSKAKPSSAVSKTSPNRPRPARSIAMGPAKRPPAVVGSAATGASGGTSASSRPVHNNGVATHAVAPLVAAAPVPTPAGAFGVMAQPPGIESELSLIRIIEEYGERTDLLRLVLAAKTEQDRARAEYERRLQEELRYETKRLDFEMMLHGNLFKQQEREHEEKRQQQQQQQQLMPPPAIPTAIVHRADMVLHSPIGPPPQPVHQPMHYVAPVAPVAPHDPHVHARSYHHPDTPGGLDAHANQQHPFAFFKTPLGGAPIHHPSAYPMQHSLRAMAPGAAAGGTSDGGHQQVSSANRHLGIRERRPVPPAVSGLSVRIAADQAASLMMDGAPQSAPVDGPALGKRKISHDEVIKALRRKVMSKSGALGQAAAAGHEAKAAVEPRRSSLAVITHAETEDEESERRIEVATPSSSSSSSDDSLLPVSGDTRNSGQRHQPHQQQQQQQRLPSISMMLDGENASSNKPDSDSVAGSGKTRSA